MVHALVKYRKWFFALMTLLAVVSVLMIPHININADMTRYLPDDYAMKQGLDLMQEQLPALQSQMEESGGLVAGGTDIMPADLPRTLAIGVGLLLVVLLVMCSSVMEVFLFLLTTGFAVAINMGTNALLPSVSMLTNTLTPVLQMVLSMDYCIFLMNRYRQEKSLGKQREAAMEAAVRESASSILSSAFTTVVSLLMLCFIKMKIGADLGVVLAKGVALSMICNFTVLPSLILWGEKAVEATQKKVPHFPAGPVARFQRRFRYPLTVFFILVFVGFTLLQRRTVLAFAPLWDNKAEAQLPADNTLLLLYPTEGEARVPALLDSISALPDVHQCISYPSLVQRPLTAGEMESLLSGLAAGRASALPKGILPVVYYACFRPERTEKLSFPEILGWVDSLSARGLLPEGFRPETMAASLMPEPEAAPAPVPAPPASAPASAPMQESTPEVVPEAASELPADIVLVPADTLSPAMETPLWGGADPYEEINMQRTAAEMADYLQYDPGQIVTLYRLAGKRNQTLSAVEMFAYVRKKVLPNKMYAAFISKGLKAKLYEELERLDSIQAAGPRPVPPPLPEVQAEVTPEVASDLPEVAPEAVPVQVKDSLPAPVAPAAPVLSAPVAVRPPTPLERLADMALSSRRYSSERVHSALHAAGVPVSRAEVDLLFLYAGAHGEHHPEWRMSPGQLLDFVVDTLLLNPAVATFVPDSARVLAGKAREEMLSGVGQLRGPDYSAAVVLSGYPRESEQTYTYVERLRSLADASFPEAHYWIGESEMYKELKDGFPQELLLLTLLTILSIFLIVALNFRNLLLPVPMIMAILSGVYVNVWVSGLGGETMYYLAYLVVQGILMGATIDYTILFTHDYLAARRQEDIETSLKAAFEAASHSILTSGLILIVVPFVMAVTLSDPMITAILRSLGTGALTIVFLMLLVLPGVLAALDPLIRKRNER